MHIIIRRWFSTAVIRSLRITIKFQFLDRCQNEWHTEKPLKRKKKKIITEEILTKSLLVYFSSAKQQFILHEFNLNIPVILIRDEKNKTHFLFVYILYQICYSTSIWHVITSKMFFNSCQKCFICITIQGWPTRMCTSLQGFIFFCCAHCAEHSAMVLWLYYKFG